MFEIMTTPRQEEESRTYHPAEYGMGYYIPTEVNQSVQEDRQKVRNLYDRLNSQWLVFVEVGFTISALLSSCSVVCLMRVFGATVLAFGLSITAVVCAGILLGLFWIEFNRSVYKLRMALVLFALGVGLSVAMSDAAVDLTRQHWQAICGTSVTFAVASAAVLALIVGNKYLEVISSNRGGCRE